MTQTNSGLDQTQLASLKKALTDLKNELTSRRSGQLKARKELLAEVEDEADMAVRANNEDTIVSLAETGHARLADIEHALRKFDEGSYGLDEDTDEPIGYARLAAVPWARYAATTQEQRDRRD
jgi:DnaK suppressor protein